MIEDGKHISTRSDGVEQEIWYKDGLKHREDGPASKFSNGYEAWWYKGNYHRLDGPARIFNSVKEWWIHGERHTKEEWWERLTDEWKMKALFNGEGV